MLYSSFANPAENVVKLADSPTASKSMSVPDRPGSLPASRICPIFSKVKNPIRNTYRQLYEHFGPQGWWPTTPPGDIRARYYPGTARLLDEPQQWEIIVGAVLTQNTAWRNVEQALEALSAHQALELAALHALEVDELAALIRPSLYYNQKARRLQDIASYIIENYCGSVAALLRRPAPPLRRELLSLKGIGPETADSILLYAAGYPFFVVDAYTRRISSRLGLVAEDATYTELQALFMDKLPSDSDLFNEYHALLVRHAVTYCKKNPRCDSCFLKSHCRYANKA